MNNTYISIDKIINEQVKKWIYLSKDDAIKELLSFLVEKDIDNGIKRWIEQIKNWKYIEVNSNYSENLLNRVFNRLNFNKEEWVIN